MLSKDAFIRGIGPLSKQGRGVGESSRRSAAPAETVATVRDGRPGEGLGGDVHGDARRGEQILNWGRGGSGRQQQMGHFPFYLEAPSPFRMPPPGGIPWVSNGLLCNSHMLKAPFP